MREHAEYFKQFLDVYPGGGTRRNPKRKTTGAYSSPLHLARPSQEDVDRVFEQHLRTMAQGGTWGDNMEIQAFSSAFGIDVKIYQRDFAFMIQSSQNGESRPVAHIAYHVSFASPLPRTSSDHPQTWEHYSSIRNLDGPHTGLPAVQPKALSPEEEQVQKQKLKATSVVQPWMLNALQNSLPYLIDKQYAKRILEECNGNVNDAVSKLLDAEDGASGSSAQESSSIEREPDSDDDLAHAPSKRLNRRTSRATRHMLVSTPQSTRRAVPQTTDNDGSQESVSSFDSDAPAGRDVLHETPPTDIDADSTVSAIEMHSKSEASPNANPDTASSSKPPAKRITAREKKDQKKLAQKAARKARQQAASRSGRPVDTVEAGMALRSQGQTSTPVIESHLRTLFI